MLKFIQHKSYLKVLNYSTYIAKFNIILTLKPVFKTKNNKVV